jgi:CBS domain-containing protein
MQTTFKPLLALTAGDLMSVGVVRLSEDMPLRDAALLLFQKQVGGGPVVNAEGKCVGFLSATDFLRLAVLADWEVVKIGKPAEDPLGRFMTADPVTVTPDTPMQVLARLMIDAHIHHLVVVDEEQRPIGIVSSTDVLAAVAYAGMG